MNIEKLNFLKDKELVPEDKVNFGHENLAEALKDIIIKAKHATNIALQGSWGVGKTSIVRLLEPKLAEIEPKIGYVYFDAWKYQEDVFRRQFLLETAKKLSTKKKLEELLHEIDETVTRREIKGIKLSKGSIIQLIIVVILCLFLPGILFNILNNYIPAIALWLSNSVLGVVLIGFLIFFVNKTVAILANNVIYVDERNFTKDKLAYPEKFQEKFEDLVKKAKYQKIVIVIDNLDRTSPEVAVQMLATIKTFLECEKCIFIIPCDKEALKRHIAKELNANGDEDNNKAEKYAEEFLRKLFDITLTIPYNDSVEILEYVNNQLMETGIEALAKNPDVQLIMLDSFRENIREIKQFLNNTVAKVLLLNVDKTDNDWVDKNILSVVFLQILEHKFPEDFLKLNTNIIQEDISWEEFLKLNNETDMHTFIKKWLNKLPELKLLDIKRLLTYKHDIGDTQYTGWNKLNTHLEKGEIEEAKKLLGKNMQDSLDILISERLEKLASKPEYASVLTQYVTTLARGLKQQNIKAGYRTSSKFINFYTKNKESFPNVSISTFVDTIENNAQSKNRLILKFLKDILEKENLEEKDFIEVENLMESIYNSHIKLAPTANQLFTKLITTKMLTNKALKQALQIEELGISSKTDIQNSYILKKLEEEYPEDFDELKDEISIIENFEPTIEIYPKVLELYADRITNEAEDTETHDWKEILIETIQKFEKNYRTLINTEEVLKNTDYQELWNTIARSLIKWYAIESNYDFKKSIYESTKLISPFISVQTQDEINKDILSRHIRSCSFEDFYKTLNKKEVAYIIANHPDAVSDAASSDTKIFDSILPSMTTNMISATLMKRGSKENEVVETLKYIKDLNKRIGATEEIAKKLGMQVTEFSLEIQKKVIDMCAKNKFFGDVDLEVTIYNHLEGHSNNEDYTSTINKNVRYFSDERKINLKKRLKELKKSKEIENEQEETTATEK